MEYGVIGEHLQHSFSAEIHHALAPYSYDILELAPAALGDFLQQRAFRGVNVTIPYKQAVMPYLDEIDSTARRIGAVNTIVNRNGRLCGYNTDFFGLSALIDRLGLTLAGQKVLVLGTGGTAATATAVAQHRGARAVYRVSRHPAGEDISYEQAVTEHNDAAVLINTTPVGLYPRIDGCPIDVACFSGCQGVVDAVYNPLRTSFVQSAKALGLPAEGGLYMLVAQAARAAALFLDDPTMEAKIDAVYDQLMCQKENVVLIGMPGCGKTTVGKMLSRWMNRPLVDTDALVEAEAGMPIPEIFSRDGETEFRRQEKAAVAAAAARSGCIVSTGGGAVLDADNVRQLRKNGRLILLDRPLEQLIPTADRPLASDYAALENLYRQRMPRYRAIADDVVCGADAEDTAQIIKRMWQP